MNNLLTIPLIADQVKLTQALRLVHKKGQAPALLAKKDSRDTWVCLEPGPEGCDIWERCHIYPTSQTQYEWCGGFAWVGLDDHACPLTVRWSSMNKPEWSLADASLFAIMRGTPKMRFFSFVEKWDAENKYNHTESELVQNIISAINSELSSLGFQLRAFDEHINLIAPEWATIWDRMVATSIFIDALNRLDEEMETAEEKIVFDQYAPSGPIRVKTVGIEEFVQRIQASEKLWLLESSKPPLPSEWYLMPSKIRIADYGGGRVDRLAERNQFTDMIGMPKRSMRSFWSVDNVDGSGGVYLADVIRNYGTNGYVFMDGNIILDLQHNLKADGGTCGYSSVCPTTPQDYTELKRFVKKHLSSFDKYRQLSQ